MKDALHHQLALAVGALRDKGVSLGHRQGFWGAVRGARRREDEAADPRPSQTLEQAEGATNVRFLPYQPRDTLEDSLAAGDVHLVSLLPALEGLIVPSKLYGILAAGRPLIFIGDSGGDIGRVIERTQCGRLVRVGDSTALENTLGRAVSPNG